MPLFSEIALELNMKLQHATQILRKSQALWEAVQEKRAVWAKH